MISIFYNFKFCYFSESLDAQWEDYEIYYEKLSDWLQETEQKVKFADVSQRTLTDKEDQLAIHKVQSTNK